MRIYRSPPLRAFYSCKSLIKINLFCVNIKSPSISYAVRLTLSFRSDSWSTEKLSEHGSSNDLIHYTHSFCKERKQIIHNQYMLNLAECWKSSGVACRNKHSISILPFMEIFGALYMTWLSVFVTMKSFSAWGSLTTWTEMTLEACVSGLKNVGALTWYAIMCWCLVARVFKTFLKLWVSCPFEKAVFPLKLHGP